MGSYIFLKTLHNGKFSTEQDELSLSHATRTERNRFILRCSVKTTDYYALGKLFRTVNIVQSNHFICFYIDVLLYGTLVNEPYIH